MPQDPNDEPTEVLLERITAERSELAKSGKTMNGRSLHPIEDENIHDLPYSWTRVRLGMISYHRLGKMLDKQKNTGRYRPYLRNLNVQWMRFDLLDIKEMRIEEDQLEEYLLRPGDLLICEGGEPGRCAIWEDSSSEMYFQKALHRVRPLGQIRAKYILYHLWVDAMSGRLQKYFTGATIKHFTGKSLSNYPISLTPIGEQDRILTEVEQLLTICDQLEGQSLSAENQRGKLLDAILFEARVN